jgi:serine phosphatase RsbU (regulator of sigma subunit)
MTGLAKPGRCEACHHPGGVEGPAACPGAHYRLERLTPGERRALERDLSLARHIQSSMLPRPELRTAGWEASYHYEPAGLASGDCCDLLPLETGELLFLLGDVMGKGLAASILVAHLQAIFRCLATVPASLAEFAERANRVFARSTDGARYATLVFGRLGHSGEVELVNAGHCPPILLRDGHAATIAATGLPLGLFARSPYAVSHRRLAPGDSLVLYTDGVTESGSGTGEEYGTERLRCAALAHAQRPAREILDACLADLTAFRGAARREDDRREDDRTMLVLRRVSASQ